MVSGFNNQQRQKRDFHFGPIFCPVSSAQNFTESVPSRIKYVSQYHLYWISSLLNRLGLPLLNHFCTESVVDESFTDIG